MIMPLRIAVGEATAFEIVGAFVVTLGSAAILIPLAARIYSRRDPAHGRRRQAARGLAQRLNR